MRTAGVALALALGCAAAAAATPVATKPAPAAKPRAVGAGYRPFPLDSLQHDEGVCFEVYASDLDALHFALRDMDYAAKQFLKIGMEYPPKVSVAVLGTLDDPRRVDHAALRANGVQWIVDDWPKPGPSDDLRATLGERAGRWYLSAFEKAHARVAVPAGRTRLVPDWYESAVGGMCLPFAQQNQRIALFCGRVDERVPLDRLFTMARPAAAAPAPKRATGKAAVAAKGPSPELFEAEALAFGRFLQESSLMIPVLDSYMEGQPETHAISLASDLYTRTDLLEKSFLDWLRTRPGCRPK